MGFLLTLEATAFTTGVTTVIQGITDVATFFWGLFSDFLGMMLANYLIAFPILLAVLCTAVLLVVKLVRKFGLKSRN